MAPTSHNLIFKGSRHEGGDVYSFTFKAPDFGPWKAGQHGIFTLPGVPVADKPFRAFSLASAPCDDEVRVATRICDPASEFKCCLMNLEEGDQITMKGPTGTFCVDEPCGPVVLIAGGIGITPFLSILKEFRQNPGKAPSAIRLIYGGAGRVHQFADELAEASKALAGLEVLQVSGRQKIDEEVVRAVGQMGEATFYISGAPAMVSTLKERLTGLGIKAARIKTDKFAGY